MTKDLRRPMPVNDRRQTAAKQLTPAAAAKKTECSLWVQNLYNEDLIIFSLHSGHLPSRTPP